MNRVFARMMKLSAQKHDFEEKLSIGFAFIQEKRSAFCLYPRSLIQSGWPHHPD